MPCIPAECVGSKVFASRTCETRRTLYMLLSRCNHPMPTDVIDYHPERLPLQEHNGFMVQAEAVESMCMEKQ